MADVKLTVDQQAQADDGLPDTPATGSWAANTNSFLVMARYADDTTDVDNYGVDRATRADWEGVVSAGRC